MTRTGPTRVPRSGQVVFVCTANSARSQLAAAAWRRISPMPATSAGTNPAAGVHPRAIRVGRRHGLDLANASTRRLAELHLQSHALLVAVCDNAHEQLVSEHPGEPASWLHWHVPDPVPADTDDAFEAAYGELAERVERLAAALDG
jgi:protein-tyrosine-phosphatase